MCGPEKVLMVAFKFILQILKPEYVGGLQCLMS
jgi:hypothetical protein